MLALWPRRHVSNALLSHPDPLACTLSGELRALLPRSSMRKRPLAVEPGVSQVRGYFDDEFPALLREIPDPPLVLYYLGDLSVLAEPIVAVVGARRCTSQGRMLANILARDIAAAGVSVVSGLALGIDGAAHHGVLSSDGPGRTAAVLGGGLGRMYPKRHAPLARRLVAAGGVLVSEYADGLNPRPEQFPERNRLISGTSIATVVVEASHKSGSLITARYAGEQGRDVFAMPGPVTSPVSQGCHRLIQDGAGLVCGAEDVLRWAGIEAAAIEPRMHVAPGDLDAASRRILQHIKGYPASLDELLVLTGLPAGEVAAGLVALELAGIVQQGPLGYIRRS